MTFIEDGQASQYNFKINYLTREQVKYFLLQEIMKQEPYFENETKELKLYLQRIESSDEINLYAIKLDIDPTKN